MGISKDLVTVWAIGSAGWGLPEVVGILTGDPLVGVTPPSPTGCQPLCREAAAVSHVQHRPRRGWGCPMTVLRGHRVGVGGQDSEGHGQLLRGQIQAEGAGGRQ